MGIQDLPTELLCSIFETGFGQEQPVDVFKQRPVSATYIETFALPELGPVFMCHLFLSHVSSAWRNALLGLRKSWTYVHLPGRSAFLDFETTNSILARSSELAISLECVFYPKDEVDMRGMEQAIQTFLPQHMHRIRSLRIAGPDVFIAAILDVFVDHTLQSPSLLRSSVNQLSLSHLHIIRTGLPSPLAFPLDLNLVAPGSLSHIRVHGVQVSNFPRWHLQRIDLRGDTFLSYRNHHHLFSTTTAHTLVLNGIQIPGGLPYVHLIPQPRISSITTLVLSNLHSLSIGREDRKNLYAMFFCLSLNRSLLRLEISKMNAEAAAGLTHVLQLTTVPMCPNLRYLLLETIRMARNGVQAMAKNFPGLSKVELADVGGTWASFCDVWRNDVVNGVDVWPMLDDVLLDGEFVGRITNNS